MARRDPLVIARLGDTSQLELNARPAVQDDFQQADLRQFVDAAWFASQSRLTTNLSRKKWII